MVDQYQNYDVQPDIVTTAKGLAAGYAAISVTVTTDKVFEMFIAKKFTLNIFKKYSLNEIVKAHQDLENRKILGPAVIIP